MKITMGTEKKEDSDIIFSYTWDDAINDGTFIRVDDKIRQEAGIKYPTAVTSNLYHSYLKPDKPDFDGRLWDVLWMLRFGKHDGSMTTFQVKIGNKNVTLWAVCEARSPQNPEPIITIMLPEDR